MASSNSNKKQFWLGFLAGALVAFLYAWLSIWATYVELERGSRAREAELRQIKRIIYFSKDIFIQRKDSFEWNLQMVLPTPEWAQTEEDNQ